MRQFLRARLVDSLTITAYAAAEGNHVACTYATAEANIQACQYTHGIWTSYQRRHGSHGPTLAVCFPFDLVVIVVVVVAQKDSQILNEARSGGGGTVSETSM